MKKNFSAQPLDTNTGGVLNVLTAKDLMSQVPNQDMNRTAFTRRPLFVDNCRDCKGFIDGSRKRNIFGLGNKKEDGVIFDSGADLTDNKKFKVGDVLDTLKFGVQTWSSSQQRKADAEAAAAALELAKRQNAAEALRLQQQQEKTATIKKYALPIAITGGVVILGIITYFVFKKKKIS
jgi:hypothetical protein